MQRIHSCGFNVMSLSCVIRMTFHFNDERYFQFKVHFDLRKYSPIYETQIVWNFYGELVSGFCEMLYVSEKKAEH